MAELLDPDISLSSIQVVRRHQLQYRRRPKILSRFCQDFELRENVGEN